MTIFNADQSGGSDDDFDDDDSDNNSDQGGPFDRKKVVLNLMDDLPGYREKFEEISDADKLDKVTIDLISILLHAANNGANNGMIIKASYILGAYNESRGLHATKH